MTRARNANSRAVARVAGGVAGKGAAAAAGAAGAIVERLCNTKER